MDPRQRLIERIGDVNDVTRPRPVVTLEEFFEGNDADGSIGCNLPGAVTPAEFYAFLLALRARPDVADVRVEVSMHDDPDGWPFADTVWVVTALPTEALAGLFPERLRPDEWCGYPPPYPCEPVDAPRGTHVVAAWYD